MNHGGSSAELAATGELRMSTVTKLITAEEYAEMPDSGVLTELVRGKVIELNQPYPRHGEVCVRIVQILTRHLDSSPTGRLVSNDSGIITERNPDTVRGGDVWYISYQKAPKGPLKQGYLDVVPDIVFEVLSPSDRWSRVLMKVGEYLDVGVSVVCVLDPEQGTARIFYPDSREEILEQDEKVTFPDQLPGFEVPVQTFFE